MKTKKLLKDKKLSIYKNVVISNEIGDQIETWLPLENGENIWAYYRQASANEYFSAATTNYKVEAIFTINYRSDINNTMRIRFRNNEYEITRIDDFEGYKKDLQIYAYTTNRMVIPE